MLPASLGVPRLVYTSLWSLSKRTVQSASASDSSPHEDLSHPELRWAHPSLFFSKNGIFVTIKSLNFKQILGLRAHIYQLVKF